MLEALPGSERLRMLSGCEPVELAFADELVAPGGRMRHVYFPTSSYISQVVRIGGSAALEVGLIGREGMLGIPIALGVDVSSARAVVQGAGVALRMDIAQFCDELERSQALQGAIHRYAFVRMSQLAQLAACTRFHVLEARLSRWLLMTQDRAQADTFHVTQELLAVLLGVRRAGITKAATTLQGRGLIDYRRGTMTVLQRRGLKAASCACYEADRAAYDRVLG